MTFVSSEISDDQVFEMNSSTDQQTPARNTRSSKKNMSKKKVEAVCDVNISLNGDNSFVSSAKKVNEIEDSNQLVLWR